MLTDCIRLLCVLSALTWLSACAPIAAIVGYGGSSMQMAATMDRLKLAGDGVSYLGSGKTITDHAVSMAVGADCHLLNVMSSQPVCAPAHQATAGSTSPQVQAAATGDEIIEGEAPAPAVSPYAMDGKLIAGFRSGADDNAPDP